MISAYLLTLVVCLIIVAGRTAPGSAWTSQEPPRAYDTEVALSTPEPRAPTVVSTQSPGRAVVLDLQAEDIPFTALTAYRRAAAILAQVAPDCGLRWSLIAAIGRAESNHGQTVGASLDSDGMSRPATDPARHGVGPMRLYPSVWKVVAVDGDGDGRRVAEDIDDAALAAGVYLCAGGTDLRTRSGMAAAVRGYNDSKRYVALVLGYEKLYRDSDFLVVATSGEVAPASIVLSGPRLEATPFSRPSPSEKARARIRAEARVTMARAARPGATAGPASPSPTPSAGPSDVAEGNGSEQPFSAGDQTSGAPVVENPPAADEDPPDPGQTTPGTPDTPNPEQPTPGTPGTPDPEQPTNDTPDTPNPEQPTPGTPGTSDPEQPTPGTPGTSDPEQPTPGTPGTPNPEQPTNDNPDGAETRSPSAPGPPGTPDASPDACVTTDANARSDATARGTAGTGEETVEHAGGAANQAAGKDEAAACPDPAPEPCTGRNESTSADPGADQGTDPPADPSGPPEENACRPSQVP